MYGLVVPPFPSEDDGSQIVDWLELAAAAGRRPITMGNLRQTLEREDVSDVDNRLADAWSEIRRRAALYGPAWPLRLRGSELGARPGHPHALLHYFLAALSLGTNVTNPGRQLFEFVVAQLAKGLTGNTSLRIGYPRSRGMPRGLDEAIDLYVQLSKERRGEPLAADDNDFALDVVTWRAFRDRRGGYLQFIGQCATGRDWYEDRKAQDLEVRNWTPYIHWAIEPPVRFFAIPFVVPEDRWFRTSRAAGLVLDRPRLLELADRQVLSRKLKGKLYAYCRSLYNDGALLDRSA